ncbi:Oidioi.mRNA.OKI2018_I69.PAR.g9330.t1.cds [Oikopleura dioica]|uniref:Oidioi.mRNA.OKI2018_I69.PAR.g9330.t1.cds n=1 Tax=Oikopleura dioica TaxID=34765 RepID=A0ABN7RNK0_OIKDI|nr:Oidioi.mRNA.OKI2018_I69.PAR.g9330.t1.cds [Oikopleura dioica]
MAFLDKRRTSVVSFADPIEYTVGPESLKTTIKEKEDEQSNAATRNVSTASWDSIEKPEESDDRDNFGWFECLCCCCIKICNKI